LDIENYLDIGLVSYSLAGLEGMDVGVQNLTIKEILKTGKITVQR